MTACDWLITDQGYAQMIYTTVRMNEYLSLCSFQENAAAWRVTHPTPNTHTSACAPTGDRTKGKSGDQGSADSLIRLGSNKVDLLSTFTSRLLQAVAVLKPGARL